MTKRRKQLTMTVTVSVSPDMTASEARREIRTLINYQSNYTYNPEDITCRKVVPGKKEIKR